MRIGFDMLAVQSPHHGARGIGRYSRHLVDALLARDDGHEYFLYAHDGLPAERVASAPRAILRRLGPDALTAAQRVDRLARANPDGLDVLVVLSPFERWSGYCPPSQPCNGLKLVAVVYDLIPFLFADDDAPSPALARHYRVLEDLRRYDALLAISDATRRDCLRLMGLPAARVTTIGGASDGRFFVPDRSAELPAASRSVLEGLGIDRPFVLNVGGFDERKNLWRLIDAFALLPERLRKGLQFVLTFAVLPDDRDRLLAYARGAGVGGSLVMTGAVSDEALRVLYQRCAAFAFPSLYEGFGLPLLEAMHCGAAVVAGDNSSQREVVGGGGLLANAGDASDIASKLAMVLGDAALASALRSRAVAAAGRFSWADTAARAAAVLDRLGSNHGPAGLRRCVGHGRPAKPRIAFFSPFPPRKSGIAEYAVALIDALKPTYTIDLYHDSGYVPEPALREGGLACCDARLFARQAAVRDYRGIVYQMGNSRYHRFLYEVMLSHPGVVTLHDPCLAGFHLDYGRWRGCEQEFLRAELLRWYPEDADAIEDCLDPWPGDWRSIMQACAERGWHLNRAILATAGRVVVHSRWSREQVGKSSPGDAARVDLIPLGSKARDVPGAAGRAAIRDRFGLPREAMIVASFGFINAEKMNVESLDAFRSLAEVDPSALFVFAGEEADGGVARSRARGLTDRVRFLGRQPADAYADLIAVTDIGLALRRPPTNGETSAALLDLLAAGVATLVTDVATFADYPDAVVRKVRWGPRGPDDLARALRALAADPHDRAALGNAARDHVRSNHSWSRVAERYVDAIERCHAGSNARASPAQTPTPTPTPTRVHVSF